MIDPQGNDTGGCGSFGSPKKGRPLMEVFAEDPWPDVFRVRDDLQST